MKKSLSGVGDVAVWAVGQAGGLLIGGQSDPLGVVWDVGFSFVERSAGRRGEARRAAEATLDKLNTLVNMGRFDEAKR